MSIESSNGHTNAEAAAATSCRCERAPGWQRPGTESQDALSTLVSRRSSRTSEDASTFGLRGRIAWTLAIAAGMYFMYWFGGIFMAVPWLITFGATLLPRILRDLWAPAIQVTTLRPQAAPLNDHRWKTWAGEGPCVCSEHSST